MNKQLYTVIRILEWLYRAAYVLCISIIGYQVFFYKPATPPSAIPVLSVTVLQADEQELAKRVILPENTKFTASASGTFGKQEPFQ